MDTISNKQKVLLFYKQIVGQRRAELIPEFVQENYIQHNPMVKQGRAGITEMIKYLKTLPPPPVGAKSPIIRAIQEDDLVVTHLDIAFMGKHMVVIDLFRLKDGMLAEHWDVIQELPDETGLAVTTTNGVADIDTMAFAADTRKVVNDFYQLVKDKEPAVTFFQEDYIEHDAAIIQQGKGLIGYLTKQPDRHIKIYRMVCEGDFAMVQSSFYRGDKSFALYEIFRVKDGRIAEHWSVEQVIPDGVAVDAMF